MEKKNIVKMIVFPILLTASILALNFGLFQKVGNDLTSYGAFYKEERDSLDVVFMGSSTVREGIIPTELWKKDKLTSRSISSSPTHPEVIKNMISQVEETQHPKLVYIDIYGLTYQLKEDAPFFIKTYYNSLSDEGLKKELEEKYDYLSSSSENELFKNHNNFRQQAYWESIVYPQQFLTKGYYPNTYTAKLTSYLVDYAKVETPSNDGIDYMNEILNICDQYRENTTYIFGRTARYISSESDRDATYQLNYFKDMINKKGYVYIDFTKDIAKMNLNIDEDQKDSEHLNHKGAVKFSDYFADYIMDNYKDLFSFEHKDSVKEDFDDCLVSCEEYFEKIQKRMK